MILYFIGLTESYEGEGYDRKNLKIPQNQEELLAEIAETVGKDHIAKELVSVVRLWILVLKRM